MAVASDPDSSGEDSIVENSRQMQAQDKVGPPDKIGEVFGGLYVVLVSKVLRRIFKGKDIAKKFRANGLLLGKEHGGTLCIDLKVGISKLVDTNLGPDTLCPLLRLLF